MKRSMRASVVFFVRSPMLTVSVRLGARLVTEHILTAKNKGSCEIVKSGKEDTQQPR